MFKSLFVALAATATLASAAPTSAPVAEKRDGASGVGTWYEQNGNPGNCGWWKSDWDNIVALNNNFYNGGSLCGKWITIRNKDTGATTAAMVADSCPSCESYGDIDLSKNVFGQLTNWNYDQGVVNIDWWVQ